jgi:putative peptide maturation dehydrogenase
MTSTDPVVPWEGWPWTESAPTTLGWYETALRLHGASRWRARDVRTGLPPGWSLEAAVGDSATRYAEAFEQRGEPPGEFYHHAAASRLSTLLEPRTSDLLDLLRKRHTVRRFQHDGKLAMEDLSTVLGAVWGCQGTVEVAPGLVTLRKTSPSGGALHPLEVFLFVRRAEGVAPGIYHYDVKAHSLAAIHAMPADEVEDLLIGLLAGQEYLATANVVFALAIRFDRFFWKYHNHERAYLALAIETGHFCQTFQLVCTDLDYGSFVTAAINSGDVDDVLGLDGRRIAVLAMTGCGVPFGGDSPLHPIAKPFVASSTL